MRDKWEWARYLGASAIFLVAISIVAVCVWIADPDWIYKLPLIRTESAADNSAILTQSEIEEIARAWTANNTNGAAGDEIVNLIVQKSNTKQPDMLREYLRERVESATDWSYGPVAKASENVYELTATASTRVHDTMPPPTISFVGVINAPTPDPADFTRIATAPFRLTVDADAMSVTDWRLRADGAGVVSSFGSASIAMFEDVYEESAANCINAAMMEDPTEQDARTLFLPPDAREEADAARLRAFVHSAGLGEICEDWIGE